MRKIYLLLVVFSMFSIMSIPPVYGEDDLSSKEAELNNKMDKIKELDKDIRRLEREELKIKQNKELTAEQKRVKGKKLRQLIKDKTYLKNNLDYWSGEADGVKSNLNKKKASSKKKKSDFAHLQDSYSSEFLDLFFLNVPESTTETVRKQILLKALMAYQEDILFDIDTDYLKDMNAISSNQSKLSDIHNKIDAKQKEQNKVEENYKKYKKVNEKLDSDMKNLKNREKDISNQTKTLTAEKNKLEREALELENFIADLINSQSGDGSTQVNNILIERPCQGPIVKQFGEKLNALSNVHYKGLNINVPPGNDVHAVYSGKIIYNGYVKSKGQVVIVDHKNGFVSVYAYNSSVKVNKDDEVKQGDVIGVSGTNSSGVPMVYFELRKNNIPVNPEVYFK